MFRKGASAEARAAARVMAFCTVCGAWARTIRQKTEIVFPTKKIERKNAVRRTECRATSHGTTLQRSLTALEELWTWGADNGVKGLDFVEPRDTGNGKLGLYSKKAVGKEQEVIFVPGKLYINKETALSNPRIGLALKSSKLRPWVCIALHVIDVRNSLRSASPYYQSLPETTGSPLLWSQELIELLSVSEVAYIMDIFLPTSRSLVKRMPQHFLQGTQLYDSIISYKNYVGREYEKLVVGLFTENPSLFDKSVFSEETFLWAFAIIRAYSVPELKGNDLALVPFIDLTAGSSNESSLVTAGVRVEKLNRRNAISLKATDVTKEGTLLALNTANPEITSSSLLLNRGILNDTPAIAGYSISAELDPEDKFIDDKIDILDVFGFGDTGSFEFTLRRNVADSPIDNDMMAFLRLVATSGKDSFHLEALFRNEAWNHFLTPISRENEESVCSGMISGITDTMSRITKGEERAKQTLSDLVENQSPELIRAIEVARRIRASERVILEDSREYFEKRNQNLDKLEYYAEKRLKSLGLMDDDGETTWDGMMGSGIM